MGCECNNCDAICQQITPQKGSNGTTYYHYWAYADDASGTNFSTDPLDGGTPRTHLSLVITTTQETNDLSLHQNQGIYNGNFVRYIGQNGQGTNSVAKILINDNTATGTKNQSPTELKSKTISAGTVANNGDILRIKTSMNKDTSVVEECDIELRIWWDDGVNTSSFYTQKISAFGMAESDSESMIDVQLNRVSNDKASADSKQENAGGSIYQVTNSFRFFDNQNVFDNNVNWNNADLKVEVYAKTSAGNTRIICEHLSVEYVKNV